MAYASRSGQAVTNPSSPRAFGVCQRCGQWWNRDRLVNQYDWRGPSLLPLYIFVCPHCLDVPQQQLRAIVVPADPVPVKFPLTEPFIADEANLMGLAGSTTDPTTGIPIPNTTAMGTVGGVAMAPQPYGRPVGLTQDAIAPEQVVNGVPTSFGEPLDVLSVVADGLGDVTVTTRTAHGLADNDQVSVEGLIDPLATGFYSVSIISATAFSYLTYSTEPNGSLIGSDTRIVTCLVGLPYGYTDIPQVGP